MSEKRQAESALGADYRVGRHGAEGPEGPRIVLWERRPLALVILRARAAEGPFLAAVRAALGFELPRAAGASAVAGARAALWLGPAEWLVVAPHEGQGAPERALAGALQGVGGAAIDVSQGRTVVRAQGPRLRDLLAKLCGLDVHSRSLRPGMCAQSGFAHVTALLHLVDAAPTADLYIPRSYGRFLWHAILDGALEYGCEVREPAA
ncbi:MAG: sarcosine oxidase subunit gamma [Proteobacteria bacterium]|nr:sarcosine oxidase subunit gamma [Pseudomonadota bacterium]